MKEKILTLIVTYNRIEDLKKSLNAYSEQTIKPEGIVVINNDSSDGTFEFLKNWNNIDEGFEKFVINLEKNVGGAGGFYEGLKFAISKDFNWVWLHDDDAFVEKDGIEKLKKHISETNKQTVSAVCSKVIDNGTIQIYHRRNFKQGILKVKEEIFPTTEYDKECFEINAFSYVGVAINIEKLKEVGLTNKDLFIHHDDIEHSHRLSKVGKILVYPDINVVHNTKVSDSRKTDWKLYYTLRNHLYFVKKYFRKTSYYYEYMHIYLLAIYKKFVKKDITTYKLMKTALYDARCGNLGKHELYKPGWKYE